MAITRTRALILDTSAYSFFRRGHHDALDQLTRAQTIVLPSVVLGELHAGFALGSHRTRNEKELSDFLDEPFTLVADVTAPIARRYGELFAKLKRAGTPVPTNDIWIAATTLAEGGELLTYDSDFERFAELPVRRLFPRLDLTPACGDEHIYR